MNHKEPLPDTPLNKDLETLRKALPFTNVTVKDGEMVYTMPYAYKGSLEVAEIIKKLNLNLKVTGANKSICKSSFTVTGK